MEIILFFLLFFNRIGVHFQFRVPSLRESFRGKFLIIGTRKYNFIFTLQPHRHLQTVKPRYLFENITILIRRNVIDLSNYFSEVR